MFTNEISNYNKISKKIQIMFQLDKSQVAVKLYENEEEAKEILTKYDGKQRHCGMVYDVAKNKTTYYATSDEMLCPNGAAALGLMDANLPEGIPKIDPIMEAVAYAPLEKCKFKPDSIIIYANATQIMNITQILRQATGKRMQADFGGTISICADIVSKPYLTKKSNVSFACNGSRGFTDIKPEEAVIGLTMEDILSIVNY